VRSEQTSSDSRKSSDGAEGIPGALSNQPPGTAGAPALPGAAATPGSPGNGTTAGAPGGPTSTSSRATRNFEVDRTLSYVKQPIGTLKRLSIGVVFDDWQKLGKDGKVATSAMSEADLKRFTQLVSESIGLKDDRGDKLDVINQAFKTSQPLPPVESEPLWQQPWVKQLAKQLVGVVLVLLVAFLVLRPLMKSLTSPPMKIVSATDPELNGDKLSLSGKADNAIKLQPSFEQQVAAARSLVGQDPKRAAQVVKDWVAADG
jgi:flagellar M-ring protein FliF